MEKIKNLNAYQKVLFLIMVLMPLIFAVIYPKTISRVGYLYNDTILVPTQENGDTVYSGKINGEQTQFIVSEDMSVVLRYGDTVYGPYTVKEDPSAIPTAEEPSDQMTGIEVRNDGKLLFRGGALKIGDDYWLYNEDGTVSNLVGTYATGDGIEWDANGNMVDPMEPSAATIYKLINNPELTHKGVAFAWFGAAFLCILNVLSILFADELFRLQLSFQIRNAEHAEPTDWEIAGRYISWTAIAIIAFVIFIRGLQ